jgi:hypothetical protein
MKLLRFVAGLLILTSMAGTACGGSSGSRVLLPTATIALTAAPASSPTAPFAPTATTLPATPAAGVSTCVSLNGLPDRNCTPGAADPRVTQDNIQQTICVSGYTKTVRPSTSYTTPLKVRQMALYGWTGTTADYEEDHLISLELGGHPTDPNNLWPEPYNIPNGARAKDKIENLLHVQVCAGQVTLAEAQTLIATNWLAVGGGTTNPAQALPPSDSDDEDSPTAQPQGTLQFLSVTSPVPRGGSATVAVQATASASCSITVTYKSGPSSAQGLNPKQAGADGRVSWTWTVGGNTTPGNWPIQVTCGGQSIETSFTVT